MKPEMAETIELTESCIRELRDAMGPRISPGTQDGDITTRTSTLVLKEEAEMGRKPPTVSGESSIRASGDPRVLGPEADRRTCRANPRSTEGIRVVNGGASITIERPAPPTKLDIQLRRPRTSMAIERPSSTMKLEIQYEGICTVGERIELRHELWRRRFRKWRKFRKVEPVPSPLTLVNEEEDEE
jgi:hypothetical protein